MPASPFDEHAASYDSWFEGEGGVVYDIELRAMRQVLPSLSRPWLEVGVGTGQFAQALGIDVGIDPSLKMAEIAARRGTTVLLARGEHTPLADHSFGAVFLITTLCFVARPLSALRETRRVLVPGGRLVLVEILLASPWGELYRELGQQGHSVYRHATFRSHAELMGLVKRGGFTVEKILTSLLQRPGEVRHVEAPQPGFTAGAGFVLIAARKPREQT